MWSEGKARGGNASGLPSAITGNDGSDDSDTGSLILKEYFPDGTGMSEWMTRSGTSMEDAFVETYTLNTDGTITILRYVPNLNK